jgi:hypothetical protein
METAMTDEEFAKLFPGAKWPKTFEGKRATRIIPTEPSDSIGRFSDSPIMDDTVPAQGTGSLRNYERTPREKLVDLLSRKLFSDDREGRDRAEFLLRPIDVSPAAIPFASYDTTRALGEGRYKQAILPGITAVAPFAGGFRKLLAEALRRRISPSRAIDDFTLNEMGDGAAQSLLQQTSKSIPESQLPVPESRPALPSIYFAQGKGNGPGKTTEPLDVDFTIPAMPWERSSPWVAPYPPLPKPPRDFSLDYTKEALFDAAGNPRKDVADEAGNLLKDIDGRPLTAKTIVGRRRIGENDRHLSPDDVYSVLGGDLDVGIYPVTRDKLIKGNIGQAEMFEPPIVKFWGDLPQDQVNTVLAHELGHILEEAGGQIRTDGLESELNSLYSELNSGRSGPPFFLPKHKNYSDHMAPRELAAEAFRAYATNPNTMKTVAPKTAAMLREYNAKPWFSKYLQFNGIPLGAAVGVGAAMTKEGEQAQAKSTDNLSPRKHFNTITPSDGVRTAAAALQAGGFGPPAPVPNTLSLIARALLKRHATSSGLDRKQFRFGGG